MSIISDTMAIKAVVHRTCRPRRTGGRGGALHGEIRILRSKQEIKMVAEDSCHPGQSCPVELFLGGSMCRRCAPGGIHR